MWRHASPVSVQQCTSVSTENSREIVLDAWDKVSKMPDQRGRRQHSRGREEGRGREGWRGREGEGGREGGRETGRAVWREGGWVAGCEGGGGTREREKESERDRA